MPAGSAGALCKNLQEKQEKVQTSAGQNSLYPTEYRKADARSAAGPVRRAGALPIPEVLLRHVYVCVMCLLLCLPVTGCGEGTPQSQQDPGSGRTEYAVENTAETVPDDPSRQEDLPGEESAETSAAEALADPASTSLSPTPAGYTAPEPLISSFHKDKAVGENGVLFDLSGARDGYVGVSAKSNGRLKCQVLKDGQTYTYDLRSDGTPSIYPLQMEDGMYTFRVLENVSGTKYAVLYSYDETISIADSFRPYLCASDYVSYTEDSACVRKAKELAAGAEDANGLISAVYDYGCASVKYDKEKAKNIQTGYIPVPDETLSTGKGICFDYASLAAAMLRSQGIPCKVIFGYVSPNELYHAWNMFYTEESGWVTVKFEIKGRIWNRLDLTFSSNGADGNFIGDGSNYKDVYYY